MGKIVITTNVSLDGVVQDPDGQKGFRLGGWFGQFGGKDLEEWAKVETDEALGAKALLRSSRTGPPAWEPPAHAGAHPIPAPARPTGHSAADPADTCEWLAALHNVREVTCTLLKSALG